MTYSVGLLLKLWLVTAAVLVPDAGPTAAPPASPSPDAPTVGVALDRTEATLGDRFALTVSAVGRAGIAVTLPKHLELGKFEVLDRDDGPPGGRDLGDGRRVHRFVIGIAAYEVGELEVPAIELTYLDAKGEVRASKTDPIAVRVRGLISDDEAQPAPQSLRPTRAAIVEDERMTRLARYGAIALGGVVALIIFGLLIRRAFGRGRRGTDYVEDRTPKRPPEEVAMERLRLLRESGNFAHDGYRPFFFAVAEIVRAYLGGRYGFDSLELTTTELMEELGKRVPELAKVDGELARFIQDCDLVKFAKAGSSDDAALGALDAAQAFVLSTTARLEAAAKGEAEKGEAA